MEMHNDIEEKMNDILDELGLRGWKALWVPDKDMCIRGKIELTNKTVCIYDVDPSNAWETLIHELLELKLRTLIKPYREMTNLLIGHIESLIYSEKEKLIDELPNILEVVTKKKPEIARAQGTCSGF